MLRWVKKLVSPSYEYGTIDNASKARRDKRTGKVEFVLWQAGQQGHTEDFWHVVGDGWAQTFKVKHK